VRCISIHTHGLAYMLHARVGIDSVACEAAVTRMYRNLDYFIEAPASERKCGTEVWHGFVCLCMSVAGDLLAMVNRLLGTLRGRSECAVHT
jgi:hypothetical protein